MADWKTNYKSGLQGAANPPLQSKWEGLSPHLIAEFYEVYRRDDGSWARVDDKVSVAAPLTESNLEATLNWQSPFEQTGADSKAPMLLSMLQSGAFQPTIDALRTMGPARDIAKARTHAKRGGGASDTLKRAKAFKPKPARLCPWTITPERCRVKFPKEHSHWASGVALMVFLMVSSSYQF
jgi:hypothetical protein